MKDKNAQITVFFIVGIVILLLAGFFFFLSRFAQEENLGRQTEKSQKSQLNTQIVQKYVQECIDKTLQDGLVLMGKQGGYIYASQKGTIHDFYDSDQGTFFVKYNNYLVPYLISRQSWDFGQYKANAPDFPWTTYPYTDSSNSQTKYYGIFGMSNLVPINSHFGKHSIESQMEVYVNRTLGNCLDWSDFSNQFDIKSKGHPSSVEVSLARDDTVVKIKYPMKIKSLTSGDETEITDFTARLGIRTQRIYYAVQKVIKSEIDDARSNVEHVDLEDGLSVEAVRDVYGKDDIIIVRDQKSLIGTRPYEFIFSRMNRMPALNYITPIEKVVQPDPATPSKMYIAETDVVMGGMGALAAYDPDEDEVSFFVSPEVNRDYWNDWVYFRITASDGELQDYQEIKIIRG